MERVTEVRRFARALFELARESGTVEQIAQELTTVSARLGQDEVVLRLLAHPEIPLIVRQSALYQLLPPGLAPQVIGFLNLVLRLHALPLLPAIVKTFESLRVMQSGLLRVRLESARPLSESEQQDLLAAVSRLTGRVAVADTREDPELLGGLRMRIGDRVIDASLTGRLARLKEYLRLLTVQDRN